MTTHPVSKLVKWQILDEMIAEDAQPIERDVAMPTPSDRDMRHPLRSWQAQPWMEKWTDLVLILSAMAINGAICQPWVNPVSSARMVDSTTAAAANSRPDPNCH